MALFCNSSRSRREIRSKTLLMTTPLYKLKLFKWQTPRNDSTDKMEHSHWLLCLKYYPRKDRKINTIIVVQRGTLFGIVLGNLLPTAQMDTTLTTPAGF